MIPFFYWTFSLNFIAVIEITQYKKNAFTKILSEIYAFKKVG